MKLTLKAARVNVGLDPKDVAKELNVNYSTLLRWENGESRLSAGALLALCKIYDVSPLDIKDEFEI